MLELSVVITEIWSPGRSRIPADDIYGRIMSPVFMVHPRLISEIISPIWRQAESSDHATSFPPAYIKNFPPHSSAGMNRPSIQLPSKATAGVHGKPRTIESPSLSAATTDSPNVTSS